MYCLSSGSFFEFRLVAAQGTKTMSKSMASGDTALGLCGSGFESKQFLFAFLLLGFRV